MVSFPMRCIGIVYISFDFVESSVSGKSCILRTRLKAFCIWNIRNNQITYRTAFRLSLTSLKIIAVAPQTMYSSITNAGTSMFLAYEVVIRMF